MNRLDEAIAECMARTREASAAEALRMGIEPEELEARRIAYARFQQRARALADSGVALPPADLARIAEDDITETEPMRIVRKWLGADIDRPILVLCGAVGAGKTVACGWAIAESGTGSAIHAPELPRRLLPTSFDAAAGLGRVNLRARLMVLDDLGTEPDAGAPRWAEAFAMMIERRLMIGRTIITSNLARPQFAPRYGERIASRLNAHSYVIELKKTSSLRATGGGL